MRHKDFWQVDAFTTRPFCGNPAALVFDADDLSTETMQAIAREMNLSETAFFVTPSDPSADYRIRIFTPRSELPFAGHPTLAAAFTFVTSDRFPEVDIPQSLIQECGLGCIPIAVTETPTGPLLMMTQAIPSFQSVEVTRDAAARMLGCTEDGLAHLPVEIVSTGIKWMVVALASPRQVAALAPDQSLIERICRRQGAVGVTAFALDANADEFCIKVRTFAPSQGIPEDPVCGSGNGSVAAYIGRHQLWDGDVVEYVAEQGAEVLRPGQVRAEIHRGPAEELRIKLGGHAVISIQGRVILPAPTT